MDHFYIVISIVLFFLFMLMFLCSALGYFWAKDEHQKEMIDLLNTLIDKIKDAKEFEQQKKWLLEELAKTVGSEQLAVGSKQGEIEAQIMENVFLEDAR